MRMSYDMGASTQPVSLGGLKPWLPALVPEDGFDRRSGLPRPSTVVDACSCLVCGGFKEHDNSDVAALRSIIVPRAYPSTWHPEYVAQKLSPSRRRYRRYQHDVLDFFHSPHTIPRIIYVVLFYGLVLTQISLSIYFSTLSGDFQQRKIVTHTQRILEFIFLIVASTEYILKAWACTCVAAFRHPVYGRLHYIVRPWMIVDGLTIVGSLLTVSVTQMQHALAAVVRTARLLQVMKLFSKNKKLGMVDAVIALCKENVLPLVAAWILAAIIILFCGFLIFAIEGGPQQEFFQTIPDGIYWAIITASTIGYGDKYPIVPLGQFLACVMAWFVVPFFSLPTGIISTAFALKMENKVTAEEHHNLLRDHAVSYIQAWWRSKAIQARSLATLAAITPAPHEQKNRHSHRGLIDPEIIVLVCVLKNRCTTFYERFRQVRCSQQPTTGQLFDELRNVATALGWMQRQIDYLCGHAVKNQISGPIPTDRQIGSSSMARASLEMPTGIEPISGRFERRLAAVEEGQKKLEQLLQEVLARLPPPPPAALPGDKQN